MHTFGRWLGTEPHVESAFSDSNILHTYLGHAQKLPIVWSADQHTIAKIEILKAYLSAWFRILGSTKRGETILFVDGFAGPGHYLNYPDGSPIAALRAAIRAIHDLNDGFIAKKIYGAFIESDPQRYQKLIESVQPFINPRLKVTTKRCEFADGIKEIRNEVPGPFNGEGPLFIFADPFGGTGIPFDTFSKCMSGNTAELLINLDADGIGRIFLADNNNREAQMDELFGCDCWRKRLTEKADIKKLSVEILDLYKEKLRTLEGVRFVWSFEMRGKSDTLNYYLVFATKHKLGMEKMKEAMMSIDKSGSYSFSDAHAEQWPLFREDDAERYADVLYKAFEGLTVTLEDAHIYALNETPFLNAKSMLGVLEKRKMLEVQIKEGVERRPCTFNEEKVASLRFGKFNAIIAQGDLFS